MVMNVLDTLDSVLYYPILMVLLGVAGLYFSFRTRFVQIRLLKEACKAVMEKPHEHGGVSSMQALFVSTASRVGM